MCGRHYSQWAQDGKPAEGPRDRGCLFGGCTAPGYKHGRCREHWLEWLGDDQGASAKSPGYRKYGVNEHYFDQITDERRAYWLGFITADGNVISDGHNHRLMVVLQEGDADHLRLLASDMASEAPLAYRRHKGRGYVGLSVYSWRVTEALARLGVTPRKSATVEPWDGPAALMPHYWRGLFDGDGCIHKRNQRYPSWSFSQVGSRACVDGFAVWASQITGSTAQVRLSINYCWRWTVGGTHRPRLLAEALYGDATVALARKKKLAENLLAIPLTDFGRPRRGTRSHRESAPL